VFRGFVRSAKGALTEFDVPGAGNGNGQGTFCEGIAPGGGVTGVYIDGNSSVHAFVRMTKRIMATFDAPGEVLGTYPAGINKAGVIVGDYEDAQEAFHGFLRIP
jgi:hypothetical protein